MMYKSTSPFWQFVDHWQTLITGVLARADGASALTDPDPEREFAPDRLGTKRLGSARGWSVSVSLLSSARLARYGQPPSVSVFMRKSVSVHYELMFTRA